MNRTEYLLTQAASECNEVAHRITKALHFGLDEKQPGQSLSKAERIVGEFVELAAVMQMLEDESLIDFPVGHERNALAEQKRRRVEHFMAYARECGTVTE